MEDKQTSIENNSTESNVDKVTSLLLLLESMIIDEEKTTFGSEPYYKPVFSETERKKIKNKIMSIIEKY